MELNGIGFNRLNIFLSCVKTYPSKENQTKRKILKSKFDPIKIVRYLKVIENL